MSGDGVDFISKWTSKDVFAGLENRSVHNPELMMNGWRVAEGFEAAVGTKNMIDAGLLELLSRYRRAVCKITCSGTDHMGLQGNWVGTGFLVGPNLLVTNHHVINSVAVAANATVDFEYERSPDDLLTRKSVNRNTRRAVSLDPSRLFYTSPARGGLDFTFIWIDREKVADYGFIPMSRGSFAGRIYDPVFLIHHPDGDFKQVSVDDTELLNVDVDLLLYAADTERGSSGAPVLSRYGKLCGLHHAFSRDDALLAKHAKRAKVLEDGKTYSVANEGIKFSAIAVHLENALTRTNSNRAGLREILKHFNDVDTVTGPYGVLGRVAPPITGQMTEATPTGTDDPGEAGNGRSVSEMCNTTEQDVDVAVWNMTWLNGYKANSAILRRAATVFADVTQDVWVLNGISRDTASALQEELKGVFDQTFQFAFGDDETHPDQPITAIFYNTRTVNITRQAWPGPVADMWRYKAHKDLELQSIKGPIFPSFPARFTVEVLDRNSPFQFTLVPLFIGEYGNVLLREAIAARIMTEVVEHMPQHLEVGVDWLIVGDVNAPLQQTRVDSIEGLGFEHILMRDPERGGFSCLRRKDSILSQFFVPEGTDRIGYDSGLITTVPRVFRSHFVDDLTSKAPYGIRMSLMDEASAQDIQKTVAHLAGLDLPEPATLTLESASTPWLWQGLGKPAFMRQNAAAIRALVAKVNAELHATYGAGHTPLTIADMYVLIYCEAGFKNGAMDPSANHSLGERGLLPLPDNLNYWLSRPAPSYDTELPLQQNVTLYAAYLGHVKNKRVRDSRHGALYRDLFGKPGIADSAFRQAKLLAGIIHGYFLTANYRGGKTPDFARLLMGFGNDTALPDMLAGSGYVHDGTSILANRQRNVDSALYDYLAAQDLF